MISGIFHTCPVDQIFVDRERRQRRDLMSKIEVLQESIQRLGLLQPIVVTRDYALVAGERRLTVVKRLGWDTIPFQFLDEVDEETLFEIEFDENMKRKDIPWQDQAEALKKYHNLRLSKDSTWTHDKTADAVGIERSYASALMRVAVAMDDPIVANQQQFSAARRIVQVQQQRKNAAEIESFGYGSGIESPNHIDTSYVLYTRFEDWASTYEGLRFNLIHCDFPYGIGFDKMGAQAGIDYGRYTDTTEVYNTLLDTLVTHLNKFAEESCHILFWFSIQNYEYTYNTLTQAGFVIDQFPFIWLKSDNTGIIPDPSRGPRRIYETAFFGRRGDRMIIKPKANAVALPSTGKIHPHEKPQEMLQYFFEMLVDEHTRLLDPTCGSGSALRAARSLGAAHILGLEADEHYARAANAALEESK